MNTLKCALALMSCLNILTMSRSECSSVFFGSLPKIGIFVKTEHLLLRALQLFETFSRKSTVNYGL